MSMKYSGRVWIMSDTTKQKEEVTYMADLFSEKEGKECRIDIDHESCCCGGECDHEEMNLKSRGFLVGVVLYIIAVILNLMVAQLPDMAIAGIFLVAYILIGKEILLTAGKKYTAGQDF